ncbi:MAG TPA: hypothetical protein VHH35_08310 [Pyrinomonadaceae bacterium]|nr:hypothetical protein [Pyrinomonadaceae bacterium]
MPGFLLHLGAQVTCAHPPGQATPVITNPRVKVSGQPIVTQSSQYAVAGCALSGTGTPPCATASWLTAATRIRAGGVPVLLQDSQSTCVPTGTPLTVLATQTRVKGT